jgi:hypothetical protein
MDPCKDTGKIEEDACLPGPRKRQSLGLDTMTEDGTSCLFNKSLLFIQKLTTGFIPQVKKNNNKGGRARLPTSALLELSC